MILDLKIKNKKFYVNIRSETLSFLSISHFVFLHTEGKKKKEKKKSLEVDRQLSEDLGIFYQYSIKTKHLFSTLSKWRSFSFDVE